MGKLYGVGVGPGDPELMTLKAVRVIKSCDVIMVPGENYKESAAYKIAAGAVKELEGMQVKGLSVPMTKDRDVLARAYEKAAAQAEDCLKQGKNVAFLTLGDPSIYSTYIYMQYRVVRDGFEAEMISGVPSFCAAAAKAGISLAEREDQLHIIPASYQIKDALKLPGNKVFMKTGKKFSEVRKQILDKEIPAIFVENCGMDNERICSLDHMDERNAGYYSLIIAGDIQKEGNHE